MFLDNERQSVLVSFAATRGLGCDTEVTLFTVDV